MHEIPKPELRASNGAGGDARAMKVVVDVDASAGGGVGDGAGVGAGGHGVGAGVRGADGGSLGSSGRQPRALFRSFGVQARGTDDTSGGDERDDNAKNRPRREIAKYCAICMALNVSPRNPSAAVPAVQ